MRLVCQVPYWSRVKTPLPRVACSGMVGHMQRVVHYPPSSVPEMDVSPTLQVLIAYQDFENGKHAKKVYDFLVEQLGHEFRFTNQMWRFDVLAVPTLREMAAKDAAQADIIIVACRGSELPMEVKAWTELWLSYESEPIALVALFDGMDEIPGATHSAREYLASVAQRAQIEFFAPPEDSPENRGDTTWLSFAREFQSPSGMAGAMGHDLSFPRWGINE